MTPELGQLSLILALCLATVQAILPLLGAAQGRADLMALARPAAVGQFVFVTAAFLILVQAFLVNDFSVLYVATNSNSALPAAYKVAAVWSAHEGSLLLWIAILSGWTFAVAAGSRHLPDVFASRVLGVLGIVSMGVMLFTLLTSNPFERLQPAAFEGNDLNPLLQDPALVMHPPILYAGYVGLAVPFGFAVAALLSAQLSQEWARWTRPWTVGAWVFLTIGIALGSWWAYYELGWGGWWFWDPVENASFMPWLAATALIHSLAVTERRGIFKSWTILLAITAFSLSLLGTFLVRSGILISVHAFASDPARGLFILVLLSVISGGALILYAMRAHRMDQDGGFQPLSRESFLLLNNILLIFAAGLILIGTLYPLFVDALGMGKLSVGPPYFNLVFLLPTLPLVFLMGVGMHSFWKTMPKSVLVNRLKIPIILALLFGVGLPLVVFGRATILTLVGCVAGMWVVVTAMLEPAQRLIRGEGSISKIRRSQWGMMVAHFGVGIFILGVTVTSSYSIETDQARAPGDSWELAGYQFFFRSTRDVMGPNYQAVEGEFEVRKGGRLLTVLTPQKRVYRVQQSPMTEAAIQSGLRQDIFIALGDSLGGGAWSLRVQYKPLIRFIWLGALIMAFGGILAISDTRYYRRQKQDQSQSPHDIDASVEKIV